MLVAQLYLTLWDPCNPSGSFVCEILQARILKWVTIPFSRGSSWLRDRTQVSCATGRFFTVWATREDQHLSGSLKTATIYFSNSQFCMMAIWVGFSGVAWLIKAWVLAGLSGDQVMCLLSAADSRRGWLTISGVLSYFLWSLIFQQSSLGKRVSPCGHVLLKLLLGAYWLTLNWPKETPMPVRSKG